MARKLPPPKPGKPAPRAVTPRKGLPGPRAKATQQSARPTPTTKKPPPAAKKGPAKVVSILSGKKKRRPKLLAFELYFNKPVLLYKEVSPYSESHPDPLALAKYQVKHPPQPTDDLACAVIKLVRQGVPPKTALANFGVTMGIFGKWRRDAQLDYDRGVNSPFVVFFRAVEIAIAQAESALTLDSRFNFENALPMLRMRFASNWDAKTAGPEESTILEETEEVEEMSDEQSAYLIAIMEAARGGRVIDAVAETVAEPTPAPVAEPEK